MTAGGRRAEALAMLRSALRGRRRDWALLIGWSLLEAIPSYLSGWLIARAVDNGFLAGDNATGFALLGALALAMPIGALGTRQTYEQLSRLVEPFRDELVALVARGALARATAARRPADPGSVARLTHQVEIVRESYGSVLLAVQTFLISGVSAIAGLLTLDPIFLALVVPPLIVGLGLFALSLPRLAARQRASILADERIAEQADVLAAGARDVAACGGEQRMAAMVGGEIDAQAQATADLARMAAIRTATVAIGGLVPTILILAMGPTLVAHGASTGAILGALTYVSQGVQPGVQMLARQLGGPGLWLFVTLGRILEATEAPPPRPAESSGTARRPTAPGGAELRGVTFGYGAEPVVRDLDVGVSPDDHLAVIGPSGVGKSTLAGLITGLLEPQAGEALIGGVPARELDQAALARMRTLIPQEAYVFAGSLRENLTYLREEAPPAEVDEASDRLGLRPLVERVGGYDESIDPAGLSAGECQLVTLVRAYLSPASLIVLDEASCHLDPSAEARVERAFAARPGSLIVVAHRISSALRARRILLLDGDTTLLGSHRDLVESSPLYRDLVGYWSASDGSSARAAAPMGTNSPSRV